MPNNNQIESSSASQSDPKSQIDKLLNGQKGDSEQEDLTNQQSNNQGVPLSADEQQQAQGIEQQIQNFEQKLEPKSTTELKQLSTQLETVEKTMLLKKIDNQLHTMKDTVAKPGDMASPAAAETAAGAVSANQTDTTTP